jgi:hypothetical protein
MARRNMLGIMLDNAELREIERAASTLKMPKSHYARLILTGGGLQKAQPRWDSPLVAKIETEFAQMRTEHAEMRELLVSISRSFEALLAFLREAQRIPTFREFRERCLAEHIVQLATESDFQYLLRIANRYFVLYQKWPTPTDFMNFGPVTESFKSETWPLVPPR